MFSGSLFFLNSVFNVFLWWAQYLCVCEAGRSRDFWYMFMSCWQLKQQRVQLQLVSSLFLFSYVSFMYFKRYKGELFVHVLHL